MLKLKITTILLAIIILSGCIGGSPKESGSAIGGVMRSDDSGNSFISKSKIDEKTSLVRTNVLSMAIDPSDGNTVYAGTQENGFYVSDNKGETWKSLNLPLANIKGVIINPQNTRNIYVSGMLNGRGTIFRTDDKGENFKEIYIEPIDGTNITALNIHPKNPNIIYAGLSSGLLIRSFNGGKTWEDLFSLEETNILEILFDADDTKTIYVLNSKNGLYKSRDGSLTFTDVSLLEREENQKIYEGNIYSLAVDPDVSGLVLVGTDNGIFQSIDYGLSWKEVDTIDSVKGIPIYALAINPHNTDQIVYAAAKAVYTKIGNSWAITDTTSNRVVNVIKHDPVKNGVIYMGLMSVGK